MSRPRHVNHIEPVPDNPAIMWLTAFCAIPGWPPAVLYDFDTYFLPLVQEHHWYVGRGGRLCTHVGPKRKTLYLARHITKARKNQRVSHIDGDVTNLRAENLCVKTLARKKPRV